MSQYAQKSYLQIQGINGKYRIEQIGCFVTSFSNLFSSFGREVDPVALNNEFVNKGIYIDIDDGIRDDLDWDSITRDDSSIVVTQTVNHGKERSAGWPSTSDAIVRFYYQSVHTGQWIFHFCKVADANSHTIIDSWDGQVKASPYGEPTAWATYQHNVPLAPPVQVRPPRFSVVETYEPAKQIKLNKQPTNLWGMNWTFDYMKDHPVEVHEQNEVWSVTNKVHHEDGYDYYRREGEVDGFNVLDCDDYIPPQPQLAVVDSTVAPTLEPVAVPASEESEEVPIEVKVITKPLFTPFKDGNHRMTAQKSMPLQDIFDPTIQAQLVAGSAIIIAGTFPYNGHIYYRTANSVKNNLFVPVPLDAVKSQNYAEDDEQAFQQVTDEMLREANITLKTTRDKSVAKAGTFFGWFAKLLHIKK